MNNLGRPPRESACECERTSDLRLGSVMALLSGPAIADAIGDASYTQSRGNTGTMEMGSNNPLNYESTTVNDQASVQYRHRGGAWRIDGQASHSASRRERSSPKPLWTRST